MKQRAAMPLLKRDARFANGPFARQAEEFRESGRDIGKGLARAERQTQAAVQDDERHLFAG